jgi:hypothetical protein|tara:strand:- start:199 stop:1128 length:930 start_codon:yes stop_codon:yes gene_type:complete
MADLQFHSNKHIRHQATNINRGDCVYLEDTFSRAIWSLYFRVNNINEDNLDITYITEEQFMKTDITFDSIVGNPPYTRGNEKLYTRFTKRALELSDTVTFIMPVDLESNHVTLKAHNRLIKTHLKDLGENISNRFDVGQHNIHTVVLDKNIVNKVEDYINPLDNYDTIFKDRARLKVYKGANAVETAPEIVGGKEIIFKILKGNKIVYKHISDEVIQKVNKNRRVSSPWLVCINHTPSLGVFNCNYVKNKEQPWAMNVIVIEASSEEEAKTLQAWMISETIQTEIIKIFALKNIYTVSKEILERLPWYE